MAVLRGKIIVLVNIIVIGAIVTTLVAVYLNLLAGAVLLVAWFNLVFWWLFRIMK